MSTDMNCAPRHPAAALASLLLALVPAACLFGCNDGAAPPSDAQGASNAKEHQGLVITNPSGDRPYFFDFETVPDGTTVSHTFKIKNTDPVPVSINDLTPSCSCTSPRISYTAKDGTLVKGSYISKPVITLPPGAEAELVVSINTLHVARKNIDKLAMVVLRCDSENRPFMSFEMHLVASKAYQVTPSIIHLQNVPVSTGARGHTDLITGIEGASNRILGIQSSTEGLTASVEEIAMGGGTLWRVQAILEPPLKMGPWQGEIILRSTDDGGVEQGQPFHIKVRADIVPDVVLFPPSFVFVAGGDVASMKADCVLRALTPGHRVRIVDALLQGSFPPALEVTWSPQTPDSDGRSARWDVSLSLPPGISPASFSGRLQITLADPEADLVIGAFAYRAQSN